MFSFFIPAGFWVLLLPSSAVGFNTRLDKLSTPIHLHINTKLPIPGTARSKSWVCGPSLAGIAGSNPVGGMDMSLASAVFCQVEVSASGWSLIQRSPTECGVSEGDREASIIRPLHTQKKQSLWENGNRPHTDPSVFDLHLSVKFLSASTGRY